MTVPFVGGTRPEPFFVSPGGSPGRPRLLLVSFTFPPSPYVGALRWQRMATYVAERGWSLDVITLDPNDVPSPDWSRLYDLPPGTRVFGVASREPFLHVAQRVLWRMLRGPKKGGPIEIRGDGSGGPQTKEAQVNRSALVRAHMARLEHGEMKRLARNAARLAATIIEPGVHEAVISSGPHHMAHEAGRLAAREAALPLVTDFRDVWATYRGMPDEYASKTWLRLADRAERRVIAAADLVVVNTVPFHDLMCSRYPDRADRVITIMNGWDEEPVPTSRHGRKFVVATSGSLYAGRDPRILFEAVALVVRQLCLNPSQIGVEVVGDTMYGNTPVTELASNAGIRDFVTVRGRHPRATALEMLTPAGLLVDLPQVTPLAIPAKLFEYMQFSAWLLAITERGSAIDRLLTDSGAFVVEPNDSTRVAAVILECYARYARGERPTPLARGGRYSRREQASLFLDALERSLATRPEPVNV